VFAPFKKYLYLDLVVIVVEHLVLLDIAFFGLILVVLVAIIGGMIDARKNKKNGVVPPREPVRPIWIEQQCPFCGGNASKLYYPDDAPNTEEVARLGAMLESGESIPEVTVAERDGEFYLISGTESALAYSFNMNTFIPVRLVRQEVEREKYVKMKNSL